jgi:IS4 transposase
VASAELQLCEKDLHHWRLLEEFRAALIGSVQQEELHPSFQDPERLLQYGDYLSLFLFGLFNPAVKTVRALCAASKLTRVQTEVCQRSVSLGSFSEAQHLVDPSHLERVFRELSSQVQPSSSGKGNLDWQQWFARDSSVFAALPRMTWALYGGGHVGAPNRAVRLHLNFNVLEDRPALADVTIGKVCERHSWEEQWESGAGYVGDRYFSKNYKLFGKLSKKGCAYVLRLAEEATITVQEEIAVSPADRAEGVVRQAWCLLGKGEFQSVRVRVIWIEGKQSALMLVTNLAPEALSAEMVSMLYRRRWQIECFFRWVKCLLGCRHWLAESQAGVTLQLYLALIASVLLQLCLGRRPNKRMFELIQLHQMGYATTEEVIAGLKREQAKEQARKKIGR